MFVIGDFLGLLEGKEEENGDASSEIRVVCVSAGSVLVDSVF